jgi:hypothetical protein
MWGGEFGSLLLGLTWGSHVAASVAAVIAATALFTTRGTPRKTLMIFGMLVAVLVFYTGAWQAVWSGIERAALFASFLASLFALSALVRLSSRLTLIQQTFDAQRDVHRAGVLQVLGLVFAIPLAVGAVGVVAPLISDHIRGQQRLTDASWAMRGMGLAVLFSPFTVAMGVAIESSSENLPIGGLMLTGLALALGLVATSFWRRQCAWPTHLPRQFMTDLALMLGPVAILIAVDLLIVFWAGYTPMQAAVITVVPCTVLMALIMGKGAIKRVHDDVRGAWRFFDGEVAVFVASLCFAAIVAEIPQVNHWVAEFAAITGPAVLIILTALLIVGLALVGVHMVVTATLFVTVFSPLMQTDWQHIFLALAALLGWAFGTMVALGSLAFVAACKVLAVAPRQVAVGINLRFMALAVVFFAVLTVVWAG